MCKKHPKYKAVKVPRIDCEDCWMLYRNKNGFDKAVRAYLDFKRKLLFKHG